MTPRKRTPAPLAAKQAEQAERRSEYATETACPRCGADTYTHTFDYAAGFGHWQKHSDRRLIDTDTAAAAVIGGGTIYAVHQSKLGRIQLSAVWPWTDPAASYVVAHECPDRPSQLW